MALTVEEALGLSEGDTVTDGIVNFVVTAVSDLGGGKLRVDMTSETNGGSYFTHEHLYLMDVGITLPALRPNTDASIPIAVPWPRDAEGRALTPEELGIEPTGETSVPADIPEPTAKDDEPPAVPPKRGKSK